MVTADQIVAHLVGDYVLQSDWMAATKTKKSVAALAHVLTYAIPFLFLRPSIWAMAFIIGTHFIIDRWRLARLVVWAKNWIAPFWLRGSLHTVKSIENESTITLDSLPANVTASTVITAEFAGAFAQGDRVLIGSKRRYVSPWSECTATGYPPDRPAWLAVWLLIIADNTMHLICNAIALAFF